MYGRWRVPAAGHAGELAILRELYQSVTLYKNFFQPTIKLVEKSGWGQDPSQI